MTDRPGFDPYEVLGVERDATPLQVARAHRRLAKRHHPDLHPDDSADRAMRRINEAWLVLSTPSRRAEYDRRNPPTGAARAAHWASNRHHVDVGLRGFAAGATAGNGADAAARYRSVRAAAYETRAARARSAAATHTHHADEQPARSFRDSGWAALLIAAVFLVFVLVVAGIGSAYWSAQQGQNAPLELR